MPRKERKLCPTALLTLGPIWPGRLSLAGVPLGDCGRHPAVPGNGLVPFHKLSQWLAYSLIESMRRNLSDGKLNFVVLMDKLEDRLKDLITSVNQNSEFDIYAVQIEFYKHEEYEIVIPKL